MKYERKTFWTVGTLCLALLFLSVIAGQVKAQESAEVAVHPSKEHVLVAPGKGVKKSLLVVNGTQQPVTLKVSVSDFRITDEKGTIEFYQQEGSYPASKWLVPQYKLLSVPALASKNMEYIVMADANMPGKGYAGAVVLQAYDVKTKKTMGESFGTLVMVNVLGSGITTGGTIRSFTSPMVQVKDPINFAFTIKNPSNSNLSVSGDIVFTSLFGREVGRFKTGSLDIYPGAVRNFQFQWSDSPIFGPYVATVSLVDGMRKDHIISSWSVLVFLPWQKLLLVLLALAVCISAAVVLYRRHKKKIQAEAGDSGGAIMAARKYASHAFSLAASLKKRMWGL